MTKVRVGMLVPICALVAAGCAARTELEDPVDEIDASLDVEQDVALDVTPPPPPDDVIVPDVTPPPPPPQDASVDVIVVDAPDDAPLPWCPDDCTSNHECEKLCTPPLQSGRYCCDEQTNTCYAWSGKHCPSNIFDAGFD